MKDLESADFYLSNDVKLFFRVNFTLIAYFYAYSNIYKCAVNMGECGINSPDTSYEKTRVK